MSGSVRVGVVGAGDRGNVYAGWVAEHPESARVVAVADPDPDRRSRLAGQHHAATYADTADLLAGTDCDAIVVATPDRHHVEPTLAAIAAGKHVLLEKPMAPTLADCERIAAAAAAYDRIFAVCHVLRYMDYTHVLRDLLAADAIGDPVSVEHTEPLGWRHMAHSYVRGKWANAAESAPMLLAKSCHDLDWLEYVIGRPVRSVASFGKLTHFTAGNAPAQAAGRCLECTLASTCAYSATRAYLGPALAGETGWPLTVITPEPSPETVEYALWEGPYGRCVYVCDNDVVDHQVVLLEFVGGATATFTMTGFSEPANRRTTIYGTHGELRCDGVTISVLDFRTESWRTCHVPGAGGGDHTDGDHGVISAFIEAIATGDAGRISSSAEASLHSHRAVFAAEQARLERRVVNLLPG